ncbi:MAG TPA: tetratricopeptide repeat-containing glycosyltransferase family protein [Pirellulales bacterium]|nr:tetratricopeptide repeat-containing glycosyltransferase family protein [Pirellulales bacterium]
MPTAIDYNKCGARLLKRGQVSNAAVAFRHALRLAPASAEAHNALSVALRLQGQLDEAMAHCRTATRLAPKMAEAHNNLGSMLQEQRKTAAAITCFREALHLEPELVSAWSNLGIALYREHRYRSAAACYRQAIALQPDFAEAHNNLASALFDLGQSDEALKSFAEAIRLKPDYREPHWGRALVWLSRGEYEKGWPEFEWRPSRAESLKGDRPGWDGSDLTGRTILLEAEQGLGDTLQFVRYGSLVKQRGGKVVLASQPRLVRLLRSACPVVDEVIAIDEAPPRFDFHLPLLSLPSVFATTLDEVPCDIPYLHLDSRLVEYWRAELSRWPGFKIGVAWQGNRDYRADRERSIPLTVFEPLARMPGVQLISLQKGPGIGQAAVARQRFRLLDFGERLDEASGPFMDTAALMQSLDLVLTCDSAICHLAGALGVPVWVALPAAADWRWMRGRDDSPWYPSMRLFKQSTRGQWGEVFENMADILGRLHEP